jgi:hypothetical protein
LGRLKVTVRLPRFGGIWVYWPNAGAPHGLDLALLRALVQVVDPPANCIMQHLVVATVVRHLD